MLIPLLIKLVLAHIIGDFLFQPDSWIEDKKKNKIKSKYLYYHIGIHLIALLAVLQFKLIAATIFIVITHFIIDLIKIYVSNDKNARLLFIGDQIIHILIILGVVYYYAPFTFDLEQIYSPHVLLFVTFIIFVTYVFSVLIKQLIAPWDAEINNDKKSIDGAGKYIGILERLLVFTFVLLDVWSAIGFLITAKSVFRFGDLTDGKNRKLTEYVLIGTLLSFGSAILTGIIYNHLLVFVLPD
jgi:hypothetical protein